jgi:hypothetical protein
MRVSEIAWVVALGILAILIFLAVRTAYRQTQMAVDERKRLKAFDAESFAYWLQILLLRGYDGGWICFTDQTTEHFVQFSKGVDTDGALSVDFVFPRVDWSNPYYEIVWQSLVAHEVPYERVALREPDGPDEYITAKFNDADKAATLAHALFKDVFRVQAPLIDVTGEGISPGPGTIVTPGFPSVPQQLRNIWKARKQW